MEYFDLLAKQISTLELLREAALSMAGKTVDGRMGAGRTSWGAHSLRLIIVKWVTYGEEFYFFYTEGTRGSQGPTNFPVPRAIVFASWVAATPAQIQGLEIL